LSWLVAVVVEARQIVAMAAVVEALAESYTPQARHYRQVSLTQSQLALAAPGAQFLLMEARAATHHSRD
jgi:precorrin-6B methylase 2